MNVEQDEKAGDAFMLQEAAAEAERQGAGTSGDISKLLGYSEGEAEPVVEPRATVVETSESEPEERPRAQLSTLGLRATSTKKL
ncbi:hypothetical protein FF1_008828 [Malus domestica]